MEYIAFSWQANTKNASHQIDFNVCGSGMHPISFGQQLDEKNAPLL
jgi:hypothetical protein